MRLHNLKFPLLLAFLKKILGIDTNRHGIRMDAYIEDVSDYASIYGTDTEVLDAEIIDTSVIPCEEIACAKTLPDIYDIEPNNRYEKRTLPKQMRYYHGLIDTQLFASNKG